MRGKKSKADVQMDYCTQSETLLRDSLTKMSVFWKRACRKSEAVALKVKADTKSAVRGGPVGLRGAVIGVTCGRRPLIVYTCHL